MPGAAGEPGSQAKRARRDLPRIPRRFEHGRGVQSIGIPRGPIEPALQFAIWIDGCPTRSRRRSKRFYVLAHVTALCE